MFHSRPSVIAPRTLVLHVILFVLIASPLVLGRARVAGRAAERREEEEKKLLEPMVEAVELNLKFFSEDYSNINVDGLFGMRVGEGQIIEALKECKSSRSCPESLQRRLQSMVDGIDTAAEAAMAYVKAEDPDYFARFIDVINRPYLLPYRHETLQDLSKTPAGNDDSYDEETGDSCMARIMGTFREERTGETVAECNITRSCWDMMTEAGRSRYSITHQLIYFSFIEKQGCTERVEATMKAKVSETQQRMCGSIYNEATTEVKDEKVEDIYQDLFLEQVLVCGTLGFENFMRSDWMGMVMTWQKPSGCFSLDNPFILQTEKKLLDIKELEKELLKDLKTEADMIEQQHRSGRQLLREHFMQDGCLSHKSGLGFGTLSVFMRYLIRQNFLVQ